MRRVQIAPGPAFHCILSALAWSGGPQLARALTSEDLTKAVQTFLLGIFFVRSTWASRSGTRATTHH